MGNYISIIVGCVGAIELISLLHQLTTTADQEHEREVQETENGSESSSTTTTTPTTTPSPPLKNQPANEEPNEIEEPAAVSVQRWPSSQGRVHDLPPMTPEIRFELYERSCSLSDVDRPLVDGLKFQRPLVRDDGSGRRKSIRKRNSSGSIEMKASREEELRMFTSLEEEEFSSLSEGGYKPISYNSSGGGGSGVGSTSSVGHQPRRQRRFKRSPELVKDEGSSSSHEVLDDVPLLLTDPQDVTYPWGDIRPTKHRRHQHHQFGHEKSMSIEELQEDEERATDEAPPQLSVDEVIRAGDAIEIVSIVFLVQWMRGINNTQKITMCWR